MDYETAFCPLIGEHITRVLNEDKITIEVVCSQYVKVNQGCLLKEAPLDGFPLHKAHRARSSYCDFVGAQKPPE